MEIKNEFHVQKEIPLLEFLYGTIENKSKNSVKSLLKYGQVFVNGEKQTQFNLLLKPNDKVQISAKRNELLLPYPILYEDHSLIAIYKPSGLLSIASATEKEKTAYHMVKNYLNSKGEKLFVVHRLDQDTSGILLFAKSEEMKHMLQKYWNTVTLKRGYLAIIEGSMERESDTIRSFLKEEKNTIVHSTKNESEGKLAITRYQVLIKNKNFSLLEVFLETGRKNQIRVHFSESGHPIIGDSKYGSKKDPLHRLGLHSHILEFVHPVTKKVIHLETDIPNEFEHFFTKI